MIHGEVVGEALVAALRARAVTDADFPRTTTYCWTMPEGVSAIRDAGRLLLADASTPPGPSPFNLMLASLARGGGPGAGLARLLVHEEGYRKRRYSWPAPHATSLGYSRAAFGTCAVRVALRDETWIARLDAAEARAGRDPWSVRDLEQQPVAVEDVLRNPARLAAVLHVRARGTAPVPYRELVLVNESALAGWSVGTEAIAARLLEDASMVRELARAVLTGVAGTIARGATEHDWAADATPDARDLSAMWARTLGSVDPRYHPTPAALDALATELETRATSRTVAPWEHAALIAPPEIPRVQR